MFDGSTPYFTINVRIHLVTANPNRWVASEVTEHPLDGLET